MASTFLNKPKQSHSRRSVLNRGSAQSSLTSYLIEINTFRSKTSEQILHLSCFIYNCKNRFFFFFSSLSPPFSFPLHFLLSSPSLSLSSSICPSCSSVGCLPAPQHCYGFTELVCARNLWIKVISHCLRFSQDVKLPFTFVSQIADNTCSRAAQQTLEKAPGGGPENNLKDTHRKLHPDTWVAPTGSDYRSLIRVWYSRCEFMRACVIGMKRRRWAWRYSGFTFWGPELGTSHWESLQQA